MAEEPIPVDATRADPNAYNEDSIQVLEGLEAVRKRPGMYIGDPSTNGLNQCIWEVVDNAIDEALAGYCDTIDIAINDDNSITVYDNGRGIPVAIHASEGKPTVEVVMTVLHAGGKFDSKSYKVSGGLHGVGVSCVNAVSRWLEVEVCRDGKRYHIRFERGKTSKQLSEIGTSEHTGTVIRFKPDYEIFGENTIFDFKSIAARLRELSFLNKGVRINFEDHREEGKAEVFYHADGLSGFVKYLNRGKEALHPKILHFDLHDPESDTDLEVALQWNDSYDERLLGFANNIRTRDGGTHLEGFKVALTRVFNTYARNNNLLGKDKAPSGEDLREGLTAIISVKMGDPKFSGQTKDKLINSEISGVVQNMFGTALAQHLEETPAIAKALVRKALMAQQARAAARKARELVRKDRKGLLGASNMPDKLRDCESRNVDETELFLVEGDSAGGSAKVGSDARVQAILPLRGKLLNVEKARIDKVLAHNEIANMVQAFGCGIGEEFNLTGLRYGKIVIMTDADVDGSHIRTLLLTFFFRQMLPLIENGHVFVAQPPLYKVSRGKKSEYVFNEAKLARWITDLGLNDAVLLDRHSGIEREISGQSLRELVETMTEFDHHDHVLALKGLTLEEYLQLRDHHDVLPLYRVTVGEIDRYCYTEQEAQTLVRDIRTRVEASVAAEEGASVSDHPGYEILEFTERGHVERSLDKLRMMGFNPEFLFDTSSDRVDPFVLSDNKERTILTSLRPIPEVIRTYGQRGLDVQRYKGLGEMNPEQLWETTMDPERRSLVQVTLSDGLEAEQVFSTLMGNDVAIRRDFIERYALSVAKKLDI
ncbi:MAG: DNA topoisomerase (ATP-hydrolyzing) subunit B [Planctomycetota bacterium]